MSQRIPTDDRGLLLGDGLFETILAQGGELMLMERHVERMIRGARALDIPAPGAEAIRAAAEAALAGAGLGGGRAAVRVTLTAGSGGRGLDRPAPMRPRLFATAAASPRHERPVTLAVAAVRRNEHSPAAGLKTLAYLDNVLARRQAQAAGADEAAMLNTAGALACASAANLFWIAGDRLFTPALSCGVLDGVMRGEILARAEVAGLTVEEVSAGPDALYRAEAVFLSSSLVGVRPVCRLGGRSLEPHRSVETLARAVADVS